MPPKRVWDDLVCEHIPFIELITVQAALTDKLLDTAQSIVITSRKAVESLAPFADDYRTLPLVAVGPATAYELKKLGFDNVFTPETHTAQAVVELLQSNPLPEPILFPRGNLGGETLLNYFRDNNLKHISPIVYETKARSIDKLQNELSEYSTTDVIVLGSPSAVTIWKQLLKTYASAPLIATIGPTTAAACIDADIPVWLEGRGTGKELIHLVIERYEN